MVRGDAGSCAGNEAPGLADDCRVDDVALSISKLSTWISSSSSTTTTSDETLPAASRCPSSAGAVVSASGPDIPLLAGIDIWSSLAGADSRRRPPDTEVLTEGDRSLSNGCSISLFGKVMSICRDSCSVSLRSSWTSGSRSWGFSVILVTCYRSVGYATGVRVPLEDNGICQIRPSMGM